MILMLIQLMILMLIQLVNNIHDEANGDYHLTAGPSLIDTKTSTINSITISETDLDDNNRTFNAEHHMSINSKYKK